MMSSVTFDFENRDLSQWEEWEGQTSITDRDNGVILVSTFCCSSESDNTKAVCLCLASLPDYLQQSILTFAETAFETHFATAVCVEMCEILCLKFYIDQSEKREIVGQVKIAVQDKGKTGCIHCSDIKPLIDLDSSESLPVTDCFAFKKDEVQGSVVQENYDIGTFVSKQVQVKHNHFFLL